MGQGKGWGRGQALDDGSGGLPRPDLYLDHEAAVARSGLGPRRSIHGFDVPQLCGDLLAQTGQAADAIAHWRPLLPQAQNADQRDGLIVRIEHASLHPDADLAGLTPLDIQAANDWERAREQQTALQQRQARQAANQEEADCEGQCRSRQATCVNVAKWWGPSCGDAADRCLASCRSSTQ